MRVKDADAVGVTAMSDHHIDTRELVRALKADGRSVVVGGPHASSLPLETLADTGADAVVLGEGETTLPDLLADLPALRPVDGVAIAGATSAGECRIEKDLDGLAEPAWDLAPPATYPVAPHGAMVRRTPSAPIVSSRGCAFRCTFCTAPKLHRRSVRFRSPERVVDEIERLARDFGVREIHFEDNNLTARRAHLHGICQEIIRRGIDITWACPNGVRVEHLDTETLALMKKSGCYLLAFGIESGSQHLLDGIKKDVSLETVLAAVRRAREAGIETQGFFIFGLPGETKETMEQTIPHGA